MLNLHEFAAAPVAIEQIIPNMRAELADYGALLNLLDQQPGAILNRQRDLACELEQPIAFQLKMVRALRSNRKSLLSALASGPAENLCFRTAALFPQPMRPLVTALGSEVRRLTSQVRRRVRQNQMLEARTKRLRRREQCAAGRLGITDRERDPGGNRTKPETPRIQTAQSMVRSQAN